MTTDAFFLDVAKISITVAGFAGVVGALRHPRDAVWKANEVNALKVILEHSLAGVVLGLVHSVLSLAVAAERTVWLWLSVFLAIVFVYEILINIARVRNSSAALAGPREFALLLGTFFVPTLAVLYVQVQNATTWLSPVPVMAGALWLVMAGCIQFVIASLEGTRAARGQA
jgi:hypothetical protein